MGVDLVLYRTRIGRFTSTKHVSSSSGSIKISRGTKIALCVALTLFSLLVLSGIESNPGPRLCNECGRVFQGKAALSRHKRETHGSRSFDCSECRQWFGDRDSLRQHVKRCRPSPSTSTAQDEETSSKKARCHPTPSTSTAQDEETLCKKARCNWCTQPVDHLVEGKRFCQQCGERGRECDKCHRPMAIKYFTDSPSTCNSCVKKTQTGGHSSALSNEAVVYDVLAQHDDLDVLTFTHNNVSHMVSIIEKELEMKRAVKIVLKVILGFIKYNEDDNEVKTSVALQTLPRSITHSSQISAELRDCIDEIQQRLDAYQREGSGWTVDVIDKMQLKIATYNPIQGSSYIPLPKHIQKRKAVVNIKNSDNKCFLWSILAGIYPVNRNNNPNQPSKYKKYMNELIIDNIDFPMALKQIPKFEQANNISINVFGLDSEVFPLLITKQKYNKHVNLLLWSEGDIQHYGLITSMSRLLTNRTKHHGTCYYCDYCLQGFTEDRLLQEHLPLCTPHGSQKTSFPDEDNKWLSFKNIHKQMYTPFTVYADFEAFTSKVSADEAHSSANTTREERHIPCGYAYLVVSSNEAYKRDVVCYRGPDVVNHSIDALLKEKLEIETQLANIVPIDMTPDDEVNYENATECHICNTPLDGDSVRDHDHLTGRFRGAAHANCNLRLQFRKNKWNNNFFIPVVFHGLKNYDSHLLMQGIGNQDKSLEISCIPNNLEQYISFSLGTLRFIDSYQFMSSSLETLVKNLAKENIDKFSNTNRHFNNSELFMRKGVYPYSYIDCEQRFQETSLPPKSAFYNVLSKENISQCDYDHAHTVWSTFNVKDLGEYHDLYIKSDVLLLSDVFNNFREMCMMHYGLDPCHYFTSPGLAWDAMLKMTGVKLELITDPDMHLLIESGIRGGVAVITTKHAEANNKYTADYDPKNPNKYIIYTDINNLYGAASSMHLPHGGFEWLTENQIDNLNIENHPNDSERGYILEVDLVYPEHLHNVHNLYPLAPESLLITPDMLSPYTKQLAEMLNIKPGATRKLSPNLRDKTRYVVHYINLKQYVRLGMIVTNIHRVLTFNQSQWMKPYIDFNIERRKNAKNDFEQNFFKLYINSVFGKSTENVRRRVNVKLINDRKKFKKLVAKPSFKSFNIIHENLIAVHMLKPTLKFNKPSYAGFSILDLSKYIMYNHHYDYIIPKYGGKCRLLFSDTDSFAYICECDDIYKDIADDIDRFDTSNYPHNHPLFSNHNKRTLSKFKDECAGVPILEYVGLCSKMYSLKLANTCIKTAKGIQKCVVRKEIRHQHYRKCLFEKISKRSSMSVIRSFNHNIYTISSSKVGLTPYDDKRFVLRDGVTTLAYGHYKTKLPDYLCE